MSKRRGVFHPPKLLWISNRSFLQRLAFKEAFFLQRLSISVHQFFRIRTDVSGIRQQEYIQNYIQMFEDVLYEQGTAYRDLMDIESAANVLYVQ